MKENKQKGLTTIAIIGGIVVALIMVLGTIWMGQSAKKGTESAVHSVSVLFISMNLPAAENRW